MVFNWPEMLSGCLCHVGDVLIFKASIFLNDIHMKAFDLLLFCWNSWIFFCWCMMVWIFPGVCWYFDFYVVLLKNWFYTFFELQWEVTYLNCHELKGVWIFLIWLDFAFGYLILFKCNVVNFVIFQKLTGFSFYQLF